MPERKTILGGRPDPDPTSLTTQSLLHEVELLKELFNEKVAHIKELNDEKFSGINTRFAEARYLTEQTSRNDKLALDAALQAQKEDVGKQNDSNNASIRKTEDLFTKQIDNLSDKIDDIKGQFITGQNLFIAGNSQSKGKTEGLGMIGAIVLGAAVIISMFVGVASLIVTLTRH